LATRLRTSLDDDEGSDLDLLAVDLHPTPTVRPVALSSVAPPRRGSGKSKAVIGSRKLVP
jgi:hypothetical protein